MLGGSGHNNVVNMWTERELGGASSRAQTSVTLMNLSLRCHLSPWWIVSPLTVAAQQHSATAPSVNIPVNRGLSCRLSDTNREQEVPPRPLSSLSRCWMGMRGAGVTQRPGTLHFKYVSQPVLQSSPWTVASGLGWSYSFTSPTVSVLSEISPQWTGGGDKRVVICLI